MCSILNSKFDQKQILPLLAHGHSLRDLGIKTPRRGIQIQWLEKIILISKIKHGNRAPLELDLDSMYKQPTNKHCNLNQGQIQIKKHFKLMGDP